MDTAFEQLVDRETGLAAAPVSEAAVMRLVRDEVVRRAAGARRRRGPDPVQPARGPAAEVPLLDEVAALLAAFLDGIGDTHEQVPVPADLAAAMLAVLPPLPAPPTCLRAPPPPGSGPSPPWGAPPFFGAG
jgi:hypothetical protein